MNPCPNCGIAGPNLNCNLHPVPYFGNMTNPCKEVTLSQPIDRVHALEREKDLFAEIGRLNVLLSKRDKEFRELSVEYQRNLDLQDKLDERDKEIERLKGLMPPDERGPGFVGQGSWSVFAEKVVAERDALREEVAEKKDEIERLQYLLKTATGIVSRDLSSASVFSQNGQQYTHKFRHEHAETAVCGYRPRGPYQPLREEDLTCLDCIDTIRAVMLVDLRNSERREKGIVDQFGRILPLEGHHKDCGHGKDGWSLCTCNELKKVDEERANKQFQLLVEEGQNLRKEFDKQTAAMRGPPQCSKCGDTGIILAHNARGMRQCDCKKYGPHHPECGRAKPGMRSPCNCLGLYERDARNQRDLERCFDELVEKKTCDHGNTECKRCGVGQPTRDPRQDLKVGVMVRFERTGVITARQTGGIIKDYDGNDFEPVQYVIREPVNGNNSFVPYNQILTVIGKEDK